MRLKNINDLINQLKAQKSELEVFLQKCTSGYARLFAALYFPPITPEQYIEEFKQEIEILEKAIKILEKEMVNDTKRIRRSQTLRT